ncbi:MAG: acyl-CoA desaturase [Oligoflexales bacterium]
MSSAKNGSVQKYAWFTIISMLLIHSGACFGVWYYSTEAFIWFGVLYFFTALGITLGFHRYFTHKAFRAPKPVEYALAVLGTTAMQGTLIEWVGHHRMHHAHSDTIGDPHDASKGFWHSHLLWMTVKRPQFDDLKQIRAFTRDLHRDPFLVFISNPLVVVAVQILIGILMYLAAGWPGVVWGVFVRLVAVYHITWAVNSATHKWGYRTHKLKDDLATNLWWVGIFALGEGWHNNHHAAPKLARHGLRWWELDLTFLVIQLMRALGLASDLNLPKPQEKPLNLIPTPGLELSATYRARRDLD